MTTFNAARLMDPEAYAFDPLTRHATETANLRIDAVWWPAWMRNLERNDADIRALPPVSRFFGQWAGRPCLVAAAGPSLHSNIPGLRQACRRGWRIVAVDRSFNTLKQAGIRPDITVTSDAGEAVAGFFDPALLDPEDTFALCAVSHPEVYRALAACRRRVFACINPFSAFWRQVSGRFPEGTACLRPGYVVTFSAVDLAQWMGADPVVTIGNELCWPGVADVEPRYCRAPLIPLPGGRVTLPSFHKAARAFAFFPDHHPDTRFLDASGGIARGWTPTTLERALSDYHENEVTP